jgi:NitT/TauT family transport system permease protein
MTLHSPGDIIASTTAEPAIASRRQRWLAHGFTIMCLLIWWGSSFVLPSYLIAGPGDVFMRALEFFYNRYEFTHLVISCLHVLGGVTIAFVLGTAMAMCSHYFPATRLMLQHRWYPFFNSFSGIGWAIVAVLWFGPSHSTVLFAMTAVLLPFVFINVSEGLAAMDSELVEMGRSFSRHPLNNFLHITLPSLFPFLFAALRIAFGVAWKSTLLIELFGTNKGLGFIINQARQNYDSPTILAIILLIVLIVYATDRWIFSPVHNRLAAHYAD